VEWTVGSVTASVNQYEDCGNDRCLEISTRAVADPLKFKQEAQLSPKDRAMRRVN